MTKNIIIIGNGAAGISAAEEIRAQNKEVKITMITDEPTVVYYRPMLSEYIGEEEIPKRFFLHTEEWYKEMNIELLISTEVTKINPKSKTILLSNLETLPYDKLIITTGSHNFIPPMEGPKKENITSLRRLKDAEEIKKLATKLKNVVIVGGGLLGLELGWQLKKDHYNITVIEMMDRLLPKQLDKEASQIFEEKVLKAGIKIVKNAEIETIEGEKQATAVVLKDKTKIPCDLILYSIGVRPNTQLAYDANLKINRGIVVNEYMQTSEADILAAGDCAEYNGINYAIWPEAMSQGKVAGKNALDIKEAYETVIPLNIYNGMNVRLFSIGDVGNNDHIDYKTIDQGDKENYEKYYFADDIFVGGVLIGDIRKSVKLKTAFKNKMNLKEFQANILGK